FADFLFLLEFFGAFLHHALQYSLPIQLALDCRDHPADGIQNIQVIREHALAFLQKLWSPSCKEIPQDYLVMEDGGKHQMMNLKLIPQMPFKVVLGFILVKHHGFFTFKKILRDADELVSDG